MFFSVWSIHPAQHSWKALRCFSHLVLAKCGPPPRDSIEFLGHAHAFLGYVNLSSRKNSSGARSLYWALAEPQARERRSSCEPCSRCWMVWFPSCHQPVILSDSVCVGHYTVCLLWHANLSAWMEVHIERSSIPLSISESSVRPDSIFLFLNWLCLVVLRWTSWRILCSYRSKKNIAFSKLLHVIVVFSILYLFV